MTDATLMDVARRLDCIITLGEHTAEAIYGSENLDIQDADEIAGDAAIIADCARHIVAAMTVAMPEFAETFQRAKEVGAARAALLAQKNGGAS